MKENMIKDELKYCLYNKNMHLKLKYKHLLLNKTYTLNNNLYNWVRLFFLK